jgi:8-oxo-dGTP pyrophosphatase MutT (NUDIX family)
MLSKLREALSRRTKKRITENGLMPSAVLLPIYNKEGECYILFTQRTENVKEHKGQISFPGGARQYGESLRDTALRESQEEIGLSPADVEIIGELDDTATAVSNYVITPFVGVVPWPYEFKVDGWEAAEIIEVPITALLDENARRERGGVKGQKAATLYFYHYGDKVIWGATARILHQFLELYRQAIKG